MNNLLDQYLPVALSVIAVLAFIVEIITQIVKDMGFLKKVPTNLVVFIVSVIVTELSYIIYSDIINSKIMWYGIVGAFFGSFVIAHIATYGWEKFNALLKRFREKNNP